MIAAAVAATPLRRVSQPDDDVAGVIALLASDMARQVTGVYLSVDGGRSMS
jgi:NAD(P)-dependent dehydrogenase (short-subunit alcohol dehydrogenase family)